MIWEPLSSPASIPSVVHLAASNGVLYAGSERIDEAKAGGGPPEWRTSGQLVRLALLTRLRRGDILDLRIGHFDKKTGAITIQSSQTHRGKVRKNKEDPSSTGSIRHRISRSRHSSSDGLSQERGAGPNEATGRLRKREEWRPQCGVTQQRPEHIIRSARDNPSASGSSHPRCAVGHTSSLRGASKV